MKKTSIIAIVIVVILAAAFGAGLWLLLEDNEQYQDLFENAEIKIKVNGEEVGVYDLEQLTELVPLTEFSAVYKPSGKLPIERIYEGFELKSVLGAVDIDVSAIKSVSFRASDGKIVSYTGTDIRKDKEVFIAIKYAGKEFISGIKGSGEFYPEEDGGPFVVIKASAGFSQDRVRCLVEVSVQL